MSDHSLRLPPRPSLDQLRKQAKELLRDYRAGRSAPAQRFGAINPRGAGFADPEDATLADAQFVLAREYGFDSWARLVRHVQAIQSSGHLEQYEKMASDFVAAHQGDANALERLNDLLPRSLTLEQLRKQISQWLNEQSGSASEPGVFGLADARLLVARQHGFESWTKFAESLVQPPRDPRSAPLGMSATPPFYKIDWANDIIEPSGPVSEKDWDTIFDVMQQHQITGVRAEGLMTDSAMERLAQLDFVTVLILGGSKRLTDKGLIHLSRMPQLRTLDVGGWESPITDRGLEVLRHLNELRNFTSCWTRRISDAGVANLASCEKLENVNLLGTPTGDGGIKALVGKHKLHHLKTGRAVTNAGLPLLHEFPVFKQWRGGETKYGLMAFEAEPTHLLIDGPFTSKGLASIAGLDGLFGLSFFWHTSALNADGLEVLLKLPNLGFLGCQGELCDDAAMRHIAAIPRLRMLMGQGTVASDEGFAALSRSQTVEYIWGRECPNLGGRGFASLARMPSLKGLAVSCKNVDDASLAALPSFPSLRGLMPMDVSDAGFRHVGRCEQLENLWCMYCRDTGDEATEHLAGLTRLKTYYAGGSQITDRSLEILGRILSLESIEFHECARITNAGIAFLASLPRLREITVGASRNVTREGMAVFPATVHANYW